MEPSPEAEGSVAGGEEEKGEEDVAEPEAEVLPPGEWLFDILRNRVGLGNGVVCGDVNGVVYLLLDVLRVPAVAPLIHGVALHPFLQVDGVVAKDAVALEVGEGDCVGADGLDDDGAGGGAGTEGEFEEGAEEECEEEGDDVGEAAVEGVFVGVVGVGGDVWEHVVVSVVHVVGVIFCGWALCPSCSDAKIGGGGREGKGDGGLILAGEPQGAGGAKGGGGAQGWGARAMADGDPCGKTARRRRRREKGEQGGGREEEGGRKKRHHPNAATTMGWWLTMV